MTFTDLYMTDNLIKISLPENVNSGVLEFLINATIEPYRKNKTLLQNIVLDLSRVKYIEIEGALSLICFCAAIKRKNPKTNFRYIYPPDKVLSYLMTLGFFGQMSNKVGIIEGQDIVHFENDLRNERRAKQKSRTNNPDLLPVILPIETINQRLNSISGLDFENMVGTFANHAIDTFNILRTSPLYNFSGEDYYQFLQSNIELFKNIFHHSKSWGIASIHARPNFGTTVCYFDIGIGFKASVKKYDTEADSIEWALIDGNTSMSDEDNDGYGFTLVQKFVFRRNGKLKIRSGNCLLELNSSSLKKKTKVMSFPGVQVSYFIPA